MGIETIEQDEILEVGTKEMSVLKPAKVRIEDAMLTEIKKDGKIIGKKLNCIVKHPQKDEAITISSMQFIKGKEIKTTGIWLTKDSDGKIQKGSSLAVLLSFLKSNNIVDLAGKEIDTAVDEKGYLCLKCY